MAHTYTIDRMETTTESVSIEVAAKANFVLISTDRSPDGRLVVSRYSLSSGDPTFPSYVTYRIELQMSKGGVPTKRLSISIDTWAADDDGAGVVTRLPANFTISAQLPAEMTIELADLDVALGNLYSFTYASVAAGVRNTTYLNRLLFGATQVA
jgi:hypothetical protein